MRNWKWILGTAAVVAAFVLASFGKLIAGEGQAPASNAAVSQAYWVYVGNYAKGEKKGIYKFRLDTASGALTAGEGVGGPAAAAESPNFLAVHPNGNFLYAVTTTKVEGSVGAVEAFAIDAATGNLTFLNRRASGGDEPVHVAVDPAGKVLVVANYTGASVALLPIGTDGRLGEPAVVVKHIGSSVDPVRQKRAYPHGVAFDAAGRRVLVADLGTDKIAGYAVDAAKGTMAADAAAGGAVAAGSGPRHLAFGKDGRFVYVVSEMANTLDVFAYGDGGQFKAVERISPWADAVAGKDFAAEVAIHPSGRFLYASERGLDNIAAFAIDAETGKLTAAGTIACGGKNPRHFGIEPSGHYLIVANQGSDSLTVFQIDAKTGALSATTNSVQTPKPVCVVFVPVK